MNKVVLFDGVCNLCNATIQRLIRLDKKKELKFASLQSDFGQKVLKDLNFNQNTFKTFIYLKGNRVYTRSDAALEVFSDVGGIYQFSKIFKIVPAFIRNGVYDFISKNRYKWFGQKESCWLPTPDLKERFLN